MNRFAYAWILLLCASVTQSQTLPEDSFAVVNGKPLSDALLNLNVQANISRGQTDSSQLRSKLQQELIRQEVLAQEAKRLKLDQTQFAKVSWEQIQQNYLTNLLLENFRQTYKTTPAQIQAEYDLFVKKMQDARQYRISIITVPTEVKAKDLISAIAKSKDPSLFAKLAREMSTDPSKEVGGQLDWLLPEQMVPSVSGVVPNLEKGKISIVPILTQSGWNVIRVDDIRSYKIPSVKEIEPQLQQAALQKSLAEYVESLQKKAIISRR